MPISTTERPGSSVTVLAAAVTPTVLVAMPTEDKPPGSVVGAGSVLDPGSAAVKAVVPLERAAEVFSVAFLAGTLA
jgi:hypothetical protein